METPNKSTAGVQKMSRRSFVKAGAAVGAVAAVSGLAACAPSATKPTEKPTETAVPWPP